LSSTEGVISLLCQESSRRCFVLNGATLGIESRLSIWNCSFEPFNQNDARCVNPRKENKFRICKQVATFL